MWSESCVGYTVCICVCVLITWRIDGNQIRFQWESGRRLKIKNNDNNKTLYEEGEEGRNWERKRERERSYSKCLFELAVEIQISPHAHMKFKTHDQRSLFLLFRSQSSCIRVVVWISFDLWFFFNAIYHFKMTVSIVILEPLYWLVWY